ncbi:MAG: hypothetical protein HGB06_11310, partial [Chlorobaculum sp.]|nr:hypothetical protein [Chlorobaculum sp.]
KELEHPIPVIFNLSSWALQRPPIADWLVDELRKRYDVPEKIARFWIENETILPLLDGLDEVAKEHRNACVEAINAYRENNGLLPIAICSRIADYETLTTKLHLQHAVTVQPLTPEQVDRYLAEAGDSLEPVRKLVKEDETLMELLDNPLMLSIMQLAFWNNADAATTLENGSIEKRRNKLFDTYIATMFKRRNSSSQYQPEQTRQWLTSVAKSMIKRGQTVFYIEQIQPNLLQNKHQKMFTFLCFIISILLVGLVGGLTNRLLFGLTGGLLFGLYDWMVRWLRGNNILLAEGTLELSQLMNNDKLNRRLGTGLNAGLSIGLGTLLGASLSAGLSTGLQLGLIIGLNVWLGSGLVAWLTDEESTLFHRISEHNTPNEGVHRSLNKAIFFVFLLGGFSVLVFGLIFVTFDALNEGLFLGLFVGLLAGMELGGYAVIQHYVLRLLLWREGFAPLRYVHFLDHAADLLFLRKVGGGYIFVHRMIMEHFAAMEDTEPAA